MADVKISQLPAATTPLDGTEVLPIVQSATTKQVSIANVTAGRAMSASSLTLTTPLAVTSGGTGIASADQGALLSATGANAFSATRTPTLGLAGTAAGTLGLSGSTSGVVTLATAAAAGTWTFTLPTSGGTNGYILTTNGSGVSSWTNPTALGIDLNVGTTVVSDGTSGRILYNNAGVLGEYAITGTGTTAVLSTSPTFTTGLTTPLAIGGTAASSSLTLQSTSGVGTSDSILFKVGNNGATTAATIDTSGNLGLGVTPSAWSSWKVIQLAGNTSLYSSSSLFGGIAQNYYYNGNNTYISNGYATDYYQYNGQHVWRTAASGVAGNIATFTQAMTLDASGNLGIGTSSPSARVHSSGNSSAGYVANYFENIASNGYVRLDLRIGSSGGSGSASIKYAPGVFMQIGPDANDTTSPLVFATNNATERARIDSSGRLLIGATSFSGAAQAALMVANGSAVNGNAARLGLMNIGGASNGSDYPSIGYNLAFTSTSTINYMANDYASMIRFSSGKVETFTAASGTAANAISFTTGPYVAQGGTSWTNSSDERLKDIIEPITDALTKVLSLRAIIGKFKTDPIDTRRVFLIAQDVQKILPEAVDASDPERLGLNYTDIIPLLVASIKELTAKVSALEAKQ